MTDERWRFEGTKQGFEPFWVQVACYQRSESGYGAHLKRPTQVQVVVKAESEFGVPALVEPPQTTLDPTLDRRTFLVRSLDQLGYLQQGLVRCHQDRAKEHVLDLERVRAVDSTLVAARPLYRLHQPEIKIVLLIAGSLRRIVNVL